MSRRHHTKANAALAALLLRAVEASIAAPRGWPETAAFLCQLACIPRPSTPGCSGRPDSRVSGIGGSRRGREAATERGFPRRTQRAGRLSVRVSRLSTLQGEDREPVPCSSVYNSDNVSHQRDSIPPSHQPGWLK